jgi:hypothetical protein
LPSVQSRDVFGQDEGLWVNNVVSLSALSTSTTTATMHDTQTSFFSCGGVVGAVNGGHPNSRALALSIGSQFALALAAGQGGTLEYLRGHGVSVHSATAELARLACAASRIGLGAADGGFAVGSGD